MYCCVTFNKDLIRNVYGIEKMMSQSDLTNLKKEREGEDRRGGGEREGGGREEEDQEGRRNP